VIRANIRFKSPFHAVQTQPRPEAFYMQESWSLRSDDRELVADVPETAYIFRSFSLGFSESQR
jgi:hypothetical protein